MNKELQKHIAECEKKYGHAPSLEVLNQWAGEFMQKRNSTGLPHFEGYSPQDMFEAIHRPFGDGSPVQYSKLTSEEYNLCPLFRQARLLIKHIDAVGELKLTAVGNLPPAIVKEMYPFGVGDWYIDAGKGKLSKETDSECVHLARITLELAGIIKKRTNKLSLTAAGKKLIKNGHDLFWQMFTAYFEKFNWSYFDGYEIDGLGRFAFPFTFILLEKYGGERRLEGFYAEKFFVAFPMFAEDFEYHSPYGTKDSHLAGCYCSRVFSRSLNYWGLVNHNHEMHTPNYWVSTTELFGKLIKINNP